MEAHPKHWLTIQEAAEYLSCSEDAVERRLLRTDTGTVNGQCRLPRFERGKIRFRRMEDWNAVSTAERPRSTPIRLVGADVYELLPLPVEEGEELEFNAPRHEFHELTRIP